MQALWRCVFLAAAVHVIVIAAIPTKIVAPAVDAEVAATPQTQDVAAEDQIDRIDGDNIERQGRPPNNGFMGFLSNSARYITSMVGNVIGPHPARSHARSRARPPLPLGSVQPKFPPPRTPPRGSFFPAPPPRNFLRGPPILPFMRGSRVPPSRAHFGRPHRRPSLPLPSLPSSPPPSPPPSPPSPPPKSDLRKDHTRKKPGFWTGSYSSHFKMHEHGESVNAVDAPLPEQTNLVDRRHSGIDKFPITNRNENHIEKQLQLEPSLREVKHNSIQDILNADDYNVQLPLQSFDTRNPTNFPPFRTANFPPIQNPGFSSHQTARPASFSTFRFPESDEWAKNSSPFTASVQPRSASAVSPAPSFRSSTPLNNPYNKEVVDAIKKWKHWGSLVGKPDSTQSPVIQNARVSTFGVNTVTAAPPPKREVSDVVDALRIVVDALENSASGEKIYLNNSDPDLKVTPNFNASPLIKYENSFPWTPQSGGESVWTPVF